MATVLLGINAAGMRRMSVAHFAQIGHDGCPSQSTHSGEHLGCTEHNAHHGVRTMRQDERGHEDPQSDLTLEIASELWFGGSFALEVDRVPHQRLVDVRWAAQQAGRLLGVRAKVKVIGPFSKTDPTVSVIITFENSDGRARTRAEDGLEALLRSVAEQRRW